MALVDRIQPRWILIAGWVAFVLCAYPGFMSVDSGLQLFDVRNGVYTDTYPPVMTGIWSLLEWVIAGPFPMLALQSGLFLFGLASLLGRLLTPRAAATTAVGVVLFPPVLAPMAVIWPDPLLTGSLVAGTALILATDLRARIVGLALLGLAIACRPEVTFAVIPLAGLAAARELPTLSRIARIGVTVGLVLVLALLARGAEWALTDKPTYTWQQALMMPDVASTLRRVHPPSDQSVEKLVAPMRLADVPGAAERLRRGRDALDWWALAHGDKRVFEPVTTEEQRAALATTWRHVITHKPLGYLRHRLEMTKALLGLKGAYNPVFDDLGDPALLEPLHHRATPSAWQSVSKPIVRAFAKTPLFWPILYLVLAIALIVVARGIPLLRALAISGVVYEVTWMFLAPGGDFRFSHWLVAASTIAGVALLVRRRYASALR